jgi:hypothetical protein
MSMTCLGQQLVGPFRVNIDDSGLHCTHDIITTGTLAMSCRPMTNQRKCFILLQVGVKKIIKKTAKEMRANMPQKIPKVLATDEYRKMERNSA